VIAAIDKANSLIRHASYLGVKAQLFAVALTQDEAFELLDYMAAGGLGLFTDHDRLLADVRAARTAGNPWEILDSCCLMGLSIIRKDRLQ
jgi:hypothetical protein